MPLGAASGILQAAQNLGSFGAPGSNLNNAVSGSRTTTAGTDRLHPSSGNMSSSGGQSAPPSSYGLQHPNSSANSPSAAMNHSQQFDTPRRRNPDELHLGSNSTNMTPAGPRISLEQATPGSSQYQSGGQLPGSLQPGRPGPMSANTAPTVPTASQSSSQEQYSTPSRSSAMGLSHNYTRSSPAGFDGAGYASFGATTPGGTDQYSSPTNQKYTPQNAQRTVSNTPLGLADIRPRADSGLDDSIPGANPYSYDGANAVPTNSNYLAPWAIYAFDWCKWPAQSHDAGKVAVGSYLEDGHNFVSFQKAIYKYAQLGLADN
jgi:DDB1- and CUL4-associated factor 7